ncbi:MAG: secretin N-terminal domain-containing protein [Candidatus Omnitrophota bacterium]
MQQRLKTANIRIILILCISIFVGGSFAFAQPRKEVRIFELQYAKAALLIDVVKSMISPDGSASVYHATNSIIVRDTPARIAQIEKVIGKLDTKLQEVMIELEVREVKTDALKDLGLHWQGGILRLSGSDGLSFDNFQGALNAIETSENSRLWSKSSVRVQNNKTGKMQLSSKTAAAPLRTVVAAPGVIIVTTEAERILTGRTLKVTPQINPDGTVTVNVEASVITPEPSEYFSGAFVDPLERLVNTSVSARDGETIVLGGSTNTQETVSEDKIPPVGIALGEERASQETDIAIFLTPHIIK